MQTTNEKEASSKSSIWPKLITVTIIALILAVAVLSLPRSFPTDISIIGKGKNSLALIYDLNLLQSSETAAAMNAIRDEFDEQLEFVVVKIGTPSGKILSERYSAEPPALIFFAANGEVLRILYSPQDAESLRHNLNITFNPKASN